MRIRGFDNSSTVWHLDFQWKQARLINNRLAASAIVPETKYTRQRSSLYLETAPQTQGSRLLSIHRSSCKESQWYPKTAPGCRHSLVGESAKKESSSARAWMIDYHSATPTRLRKKLAADGIVFGYSEVILPTTRPPSVAGTKVDPGGITKLRRTERRTQTVLGGSLGDCAGKDGAA